MQRLLTGPYRSSSLDRMGIYPPVGLTGLTGSMNTFTTSAATSTAKMLFIRDPALPVWADQTFVSMGTANWTVCYGTDGRVPYVPVAAGYTTPFEVTDATRFFQGNAVATTSSLAVSGTATNPYSTLPADWAPLLYDAKLGGVPFVYVPSGFNASAIVWANAPYVGTSQGGTVCLEFWFRPGVCDTIDLVTNGSAANGYGISANNFTNGYSTGQWVRLRAGTMGFNGTYLTGPSEIFAAIIVCSNTPSINLLLSTPAVTVNPATLTTTTLLPVADFVPNQHITGTPVMLRSTIPHSHNFTIENATKVMNKEGTLTAASVPMATQNPWQTSQSQFVGILPIKKYVGAAEHGLAGYVEPGAAVSALRTHYLPYNKDNSGNVEFTTTMYVSDGDVATVVFVSDPDALTSNSLLIRSSVAWEYVSTLVTLPTGVTKFLSTDVERAMRNLAAVCPFRAFERGGTLLVGPRGPAGPKRPSKPKPKPAERPKPKPAARPKPKPKAEWHPPMALPKKRK